MIHDFINQICDIKGSQNLRAGLLLREKIAQNAIEYGRKWDFEGNPAKSENLSMCQSLNTLTSILNKVNEQIASSDARLPIDETNSETR